MNGHDWNGIVAVMTANWPHSLPPDEALAKWGQDLADEDAKDVLLAVEVLYRDGREFPPNGAQIAQQIGELRRGDPDPGLAWAIAKDERPFSLIHEREEAMAWIDQRSPAVAEAVRRFGVDELAQVTADQVGTARAQFRRVYEGVLNDRRQGHARRSLEDNIEQMRGLRKPDFAATIGAGEGER